MNATRLAVVAVAVFAALAVNKMVKLDQMLMAA